MTSRPNDIPPGPWRWPLIGNIPSLVGNDRLEKLDKLRKRYGDVYGVFIGSELTVVLNGYKVINDALLKRGKAFAFRPDSYVQDPEIVFANGNLWKTNRAFLMQTFHELCFSSSGKKLENYILNGLESLDQRLNKLKHSFYPGPYMNCSFAEVMFQICHGYSISHDDERLQGYLNLLERAFSSFTYTYTLKKCFPFLDNLPVHVLPDLEKEAAHLKQYFNQVCEVNFKQHQGGDRSCLVDILLEPGSPVTQDRIWEVLHELMAAGSETTASTMSWFFLLTAMYPDKQKKLRMAIRNSIGTNAPSLSQRSEIPYVEATILECLRIGNVVPLSVPHAVAEDVKFYGYTIPKGSTVLPNLVSAHLDPERFPEPTMFKPERFLSHDETSVVNADSIIPFSLGQRSCLGETIARSELFMYIVYFIQKYDIVLASDLNSVSLKGRLDLTHKPRHFEIELVKQNV